MAERYTSLFSGNRRDYDSIDIRKQTYQFYPPSDIPTFFYAAAGFFYTGDLDTNRCFRCGLKINKLRFGEDPFEKHRFLSPDCDFVKERIHSETRHLDESDESGSEESELNFNIDSSDDSEWDITSEENAPKTIGKLTISKRSLFKLFNYLLQIFTYKCKYILKFVSDIEELRLENLQMKSEITCRVCKNVGVEILFLPCRHLLVCEKCSESVVNCCKCGQTILGTVRIYLV